MADGNPSDLAKGGWYQAKRYRGYSPFGIDLDGLPLQSYGEVPPMDEFGVSGLNRFGPYIYEEWHRELQGRRGMYNYREMRDNEPVIFTLLNLYKLMALQAEWKCEAASEDGEAQRWSDYVSKCMREMTNMTWAQFISDALTMLEFGFFFGEEVYDIDDETGYYKWKKISSRSQETLDGWGVRSPNPEASTQVANNPWGGATEVVGMFQRPPQGSQTLIPRAKALHLIYGYERENPEGRSALRGAFTSYKAAKELRRFEGIGFERNVAGMPIAYLPPALLNSTASDDVATVSSIKKLLWQIKMDERMGIIFPSKTMPDGTPSGYELAFAQVNGGQAMTAIDQSIVRYEARMAMTLHGEFLFLGQGKSSGGSHAMHRDKTNGLSMGIDACLDIVEDGFNSQSIPRLMTYNKVPKQLWPRARHASVASADLVEMSSYLTALVTAGANLTDDDTQNFLKRLADLPTKIQQTA